jgi:hypothetical protein
VLGKQRVLVDNAAMYERFTIISSLKYHFRVIPRVHIFIRIGSYKPPNPPSHMLSQILHQIKTKQKRLMPKIQDVKKAQALWHPCIHLALANATMGEPVTMLVCGCYANHDSKTRIVRPGYAGVGNGMGVSSARAVILSSCVVQHGGFMRLGWSLVGS